MFRGHINRMRAVLFIQCKYFLIDCFLLRKFAMIIMRVLVYIVLVIPLTMHSVNCDATIFDVSRELIRSAVNVLPNITQIIPTPTAFFELSKNAILGFPFQIAFDLFNIYCEYMLFICFAK